MRKPHRSVVVGLILTLASLMALLIASLAHASSSLINPGSIELDNDAYWWNQGSQDQSKIVSYGGYEYTIYWDAADERGNVYPEVTRRTLSNNRLETTTFNTAEGRLIDPSDPHNTTTLGISPHDGRLHIQWVMHNEVLHYAISNERCLTAERFSSCTFTWRSQLERSEPKVTYPQYFNSPDGTLYCGFRNGAGTGGEWVLHIYNDNGTWTNLGVILSGESGTYDLDSANGLGELWEPSRKRGPYIDAIKFSADGRLHLVWTWREGITVGGRELNPYIAEHDIYYAYSDDGGIHWNDNSGRAVATQQTDPIRIEDEGTLAVHIPPGFWRPPAMRMEVDRDNQPHLVMPTSDTRTFDEYLSRLREKHFWRTTDGVWHEQFIESSEEEEQNPFNVGSIQFDRANNFYYIYPKDELGWFGIERPEGTRYNESLPPDHLVWDGRENLIDLPYSEFNEMQTTNYIGVPIGGATTENDEIEIHLKNTTDDTSGKIEFITDENQTFGSPQVKTFTDPRESTLSTLIISMAGVTNWRGTLRALRLWPGTRATPGVGQVTIDYIRVRSSGRGTIAKAWEFNEGTRMYSAESPAAENWSFYERTQILSGVNLEWGDAISFDIDKDRYTTEHKITFPVLTQGGLLNERERLYEFDVGGDETAKNWSFGADTIGWTAPRNVSEFRWASDGERGTLSGGITGGDSQLVAPSPINLEIARSSRVRIRMKNTRATALRASLCWSVDGGTVFRSEQCARFELTADGTYHIYEISTAGWRNWERHTLTKFRLDPSDNEEVTTGTFNVDYVRIID